jgi:MFS family permease
MYLISAFLNAVVYVQYLSTLPLDITASGLPIFWYTLAVALNGLVVISLELLVTKVSQRWPFRVTIGVAMVLVGAGMAFYGLPIGPGIIIIGTLIWTLAEIIGAPAAFAYPAVAGPARLKARYIGSFQFMFALGSATGPIIGGALFARIGHQVWPIMALFSGVACVLVVLGVRNPGTPTASEMSEVGELDAAAPSPVAPVPVGPEDRDGRSS